MTAVVDDALDALDTLERRVFDALNNQYGRLREDEDALNEGPAGLVIVVPITTARRGLPSHIEVEPGDSGLDDVSYAKCETSS